MHGSLILGLLNFLTVLFMEMLPYIYIYILGWKTMENLQKAVLSLDHSLNWHN